jgi:hypothetical protein
MLGNSHRRPVMRHNDKLGFLHSASIIFEYRSVLIHQAARQLHQYAEASAIRSWQTAVKAR